VPTDRTDVDHRADRRRLQERQRIAHEEERRPDVDGPTCSSESPPAFHSLERPRGGRSAALFTSPVTVPKRSTASLTMRPVLLTFDKSATTQWASPPASCTARAPARAVRSCVPRSIREGASRSPETQRCGRTDAAARRPSPRRPAPVPSPSQEIHHRLRIVDGSTEPPVT